VPQLKLGLLGATLSRHSSGYYRIDSIFPGANWRPSLRSPLTEPGVVCRQGWYLVSINGVDLRNVPNPYSLLVGKAGQQVEIAVNERPSDREATRNIIVPLASEADLRYYAWVQRNLAYVTAQSNGEIGYLHIPDMLQDGLNAFAEYFYPQLGKKALVIDVRGNGGGNVSPMIIERLGRQLAMVSMSRNTEPYANPFQLHLGPKVALCDRYTASDGDLFTYRFKHYRLGTVLGERTWGGVVGIRGPLPLVDGGTLHRPEFAPYSQDGSEWIIEGRGVDPDIFVANDPYREYLGEDAVLKRALEELRAMLQRTRSTLPPIPAYPER
jgi:tricorn protease